jgi:hypothetical protein
MYGSLFNVLFSLPFILTGGGLMTAALYSLMFNLKLTQIGRIATGTVVGFESGTDSDGDTVYYPLIKFWTITEQVIEFKHSFATNSPRLQVGQEVRVIYNPENPQEAKLKSFFSMWLFPIFLGLFGLPFLLAGLAALTGNITSVSD